MGGGGQGGCWGGRGEGVRLGGQGGCDRRIIVFGKIHKKKNSGSGVGVGSGGRGGVGSGGGGRVGAGVGLVGGGVRVDVNEELKFL